MIRAEKKYKYVLYSITSTDLSCIISHVESRGRIFIHALYYGHMTLIPIILRGDFRYHSSLHWGVTRNYSVH